MSNVYQIKKPASPIHWVTEVPGSKSITNRALLMAALSEGTVKLQGVLFSDDSRYFLRSLEKLGYSVQVKEQEKCVEVEGTGGLIPCQSGEIYVGSAGTAARFLTAMLGVAEGSYVIQASEQMKKRPMRPLFEILKKLGAEIIYLEKEGYLPIQITGAGAFLREKEGPIRMELDISESTQFLSALLLVSPMIHQGMKIRITSNKKGGSYIRITRKIMESFGIQVAFDGEQYEVPAGAVYSGESYQIEPDMSAACYFYGAAAVTGGYAKVKNIHFDCMQGDLRFLNVLEQMGCRVREEEDGIAVTGPLEGKLSGIEVDMNDFSDQALTLAAIAPYAREDVHIHHVAHIRGQESDRLHAIVENLMRAGIVCEEEPDGVRIHPGQPKPCRIETFDDHRVAMAFSLMGLGADGIEIINPDCCKKTFAEYFQVLDRLLTSF